MKGRAAAARQDLGRATQRPLAVKRGRAAEIHGAALTLFATVGYRATTMADIGEAVGIRGPSIYKHVPSKQELLASIMYETMECLIADQQAALATSSSPRTRVRQAVYAHVHYHALHRYEAFVGNREIDNLAEPVRTTVLEMRARYEIALRDAIEAGVADGTFRVASARLASYTILDMGIGVSAWYDPNGAYEPSELAAMYADMALDLLRTQPEG